MAAVSSGEKLVELRKKQCLNQGAFWARVGVTQSGGSRYENGRHVPKAVRLALAVAFTPSSKLPSLLEKVRDGSFNFDKALTSL